MQEIRRSPGPATVVLTIAGLYVGQSIIGGVTFTALPSVLRERGLPLDQIGLTYLAILPWALKFLWAPAVERYRLPATGANRSRSIVVVGGLVSAGGLCLLGLAGPAAVPILLAVILMTALAASTVDIACDGYAVESLSERFYGWGNAAQVGGAYLGSAIGSGLYLILIARLDWTMAALIMAALLIALGLPFVVSPTRTSTGLRVHQPSLAHALRRVEMRKGLVLAAVFVAGQKWGVMMLGPFLVDSGLDLGAIGILNGVGGLGVGFGCALLGGVLVRWRGARPVMVVAIVLQALLLSALAAAAWSAGIPQALLFAFALASAYAVMALGFVALYSQFMTLSDPRQAGIDFTLLQSMDALVSMAAGIGAGWVAQQVGYASYFALAAALALAAAPAAFLLSARERQGPARRAGQCQSI